MSAFTTEQWASAGEHACRIAMEQHGLTPTAADLAEARSVAVYIATGQRITNPPATPAPQESTCSIVDR